MPTTLRKQKVILEAVRFCEETTTYQIICLQNRENIYGKRVGDIIRPATVQTWIHQTDLEFEIRVERSPIGGIRQ